METRTVEQVKGWDSRPFTDGYAGLRELSDGEFSGAVRAGSAWLFMLNGRIIGVFEGSLDDFEDADGTAYAAPHPSLPLLFSMQEQGGETRAKYYTNDTPLTEVDSTLSDGKFTGYVELSENVLSGDYYVAYYGGRSMSVAFVGASEQVVTGDEAFERAADEVGIYEVTDVDVEVIDVPEPDGEDESGDADTGGASEDSTGGNADAATGETADATSRETTDASASGTSDAATGASDRAADAATGRSDDAATGRGGDAVAGASGANSRGGPSDGTDGTEASNQVSGTPGESSSRASAGESTGGRPATDRAAGRPDATDDAESDRATADGHATTDDRTDAAHRTAGGASAGGAGADPATADAATSHDARPRATDSESTPDPDRATSPQRTADARQTASTGKTADAGPAADAGATASASASASDRSESRAAARGGSATGGGADADATEGASSATDAEEEWRETTTIPSLDPDLSDGPEETDRESEEETAAGSETSDRAASAGSATATQSQPRSPRSAGSDGSGARSGSRPTGSGQPGSRSAAAGGSNVAGRSNSTGRTNGSGQTEAKVRKLKKQLRQRKQQVEQLKERLSTLESERNEFKRERDALRQEVERLEAKLEGAPATGATDAGRRLSTAEAFDGTNLFVRYRSKGEATLEDAAENDAERDEVNDNLRLEHHTQFEADGASVDGQPFEQFLDDSFEYEFVTWLVEDLLYEIRDTGHRDGLRDLYEAIPKIDRIDLHGSVDAGTHDEDTRQESFDVIMRDRMGNPLIVADLNDSKDPTDGEMMGSLVDATSDVAERHDELAAAFQVTESFFEPEALETAEAATSGGFLSREKRESFVKLSRKRGYHLCLVQAPGGDFHLNVPEL